MEGKYYLYRHIRLDKNEPFYIGIGTKKQNRNFTKHSTEYDRAYKTRDRNRVWKGIVSRTAYEIEIIFETDDLELIKNKEVEFVALYGRKVLGEGSLANLSKGGDYIVGYKLSEEQCRNNTERQLKAGRGVKIINLDTKEIINSISRASILYKTHGKSIRHMIDGKALNSLNISSLEDYNNGIYREFKNQTCTEVINYDTKEKFISIIEASKSIGVSQGRLASYIKTKKCFNYTRMLTLEDYENGHTPESINGDKKDGRVIDIESKIVYDNVAEVCRKFKISRDVIYRNLLGETINTTNFIYKKDYDKGILPHELKIDGKKKPLIDTVTFKKYGSIKEAADDNEISERLLARYLSGARKNLTNLIYLSEYEVNKEGL